ncbi:hypothetical protein GUJ93_ZPchr0009g1398 [Zizania palustris]|uniref:Flavonoid 3'-monooxygenase n=1 Tax=Zizania palustris TaxID=103762 RepID=A0A8J5RDG9_ZIZPA|nr:hypothetical protein GUJ93_ZPchr2162g18755 [Zizania palustris]KAG8050080.1 hypothetical protein GUJ93_ZPchr0009g1398 [Zizania palustris]
MEQAAWLPLVGMVLATVLFLGFVLRRRTSSRTYNLPPGPKPWPIIGNLNLIGALPHRSIHELSKRYGPLMSLRMGSFHAVVGASAETARFFLKTHDVAFVGRPKTAAGKYTAYNYSDITWSPYGAYWRQARKMCLTELFSAKRLASYEYIRREEVHALLVGLHAASGRVITLRDYLSTASMNVITRMVLGKVVQEGGPVKSLAQFKWMLEELFFLNGVFNIGDLIPWLDWLDLQGYVRRMKKVGKMLDQLFEHIVDKHRQRLYQEGKAFVAKDMVDVLLQLADDSVRGKGVACIIQCRYNNI